MIAIGLDNIKNSINLGAVIRACACFNANMVITSGKRISPGITSVGHQRNIPVIRTDDIMSVIPYNHVPVAIELVSSARSIISYKHPENALYIFGAEDNTLGDRILSKCRDIIYIPTSFCLNLAACVNVVLYDRLMKGCKQ